MLRKKKGLDLITSCDQVANFHFGGLAATFPTVACAGLNEVIQGPRYRSALITHINALLYFTVNS